LEGKTTMPPLPSSLPSLDLNPSERLFLLGALCYLAAGLAYRAFTGISSSWSRLHRQEIGTGAAAAVAAAAVWAVVVVLWPVPLLCRTFRALRGRTSAAPCEELIWRGPARSATAGAAAVPLPVPPHWYRQRYETVRVFLAAGGTVIAQARASGLVDDSTLAFGSGHPFTRDAWELLAHIVRVGLAEHGPSAGTSSSSGSWASDPLHRQADVDSVYLSTGCPSTTAVIW